MTMCNRDPAMGPRFCLPMSLAFVQTLQIDVPECGEDQMNVLHMFASLNMTDMVAGLSWYGQE